MLKDLGNPVASTTTDANGNYSFTNVPAGNVCTIVEQTPPGFTWTSPTSDGRQSAFATGNEVISVTGSAGQTNSGNVFVETTRRSAAIGDRCGSTATPTALRDARARPALPVSP